MMYRIIGADGQEYGPADQETLKRWIDQGRANAETKVKAEGSDEWKPLSSFPEFGVAPTPPPTPTVRVVQRPGPRPTPGPAPFPSGPGPATRDAEAQVGGPATGLLVTGVLGIVFSLLGALLNLLGASIPMMHQQMPNELWARMMSGTVGLIANLITVAVGVLIVVAALKMKKLENHGLAVLASVLALLPCTSPCCLIGLPVGIWALVVLYRPEVKNAFH